MTTSDSIEARGPVAVYHRQRRLNAGFREAFGYTVGSLISHRWQIIQTFKRDFIGLSDLTRWGAIWNYVLPLVPLGAYVMLMALRLFPKFGEVNGVVYITMGVTLWYLFAGLLRTPISILERDYRMLARMNTPIFPAIASSVSQLAFETSLRLVVVAIVFGIFQGVPSWKIVFAPVLVLFACMLFSGIGLALALFNLALRDISKIVGIVLTYGIFFSGVIFPMGGGRTISYVLMSNPFYIFIENIRASAVGAPFVHVKILIGFCIAAIIVFALAVRLAYRAELRLRGLV